VQEQAIEQAMEQVFNHRKTNNIQRNTNEISEEIFSTFVIADCSEGKYFLSFHDLFHSTKKHV
jgi:hypothetical protein